MSDWVAEVLKNWHQSSASRQQLLFKSELFREGSCFFVQKQDFFYVTTEIC